MVSRNVLFGKLFRKKILSFGILSGLSAVRTTSSKTIPDGVFGDWKFYTIKPATLADFEQVAEQIRSNFLQNEIMNTCLTSEEANKEDHDDLVGIALGHDLSFMVTRKDSSQMVGVNLVLDSTKPGYGFTNFIPTSNNLRIFMEFIGALDDAASENFKRRFKTERYTEIFMTSVSESEKGNGIAQEIYRRGIILFKANGFQTVKGVFTGIKSQAVASKLGFEEMGRIVYKDYTDKNGNKVFANAGDDNFALLAARAL